MLHVRSIEPSELPAEGSMWLISALHSVITSSRHFQTFGPSALTWKQGSNKLVMHCFRNKSNEQNRSIDQHIADSGSHVDHYIHYISHHIAIYQSDQWQLVVTGHHRSPLITIGQRLDELPPKRGNEAKAQAHEVQRPQGLRIFWGANSLGSNQ